MARRGKDVRVSFSPLVVLGRFYISGERVNRDLACKFVLHFQPRVVRGNHEWIGERLRCANEGSKSEIPARGSRIQESCTKPDGVGIELRWEEDIMQAAVVPAVSSSWQIKDVPQPQPGPNQVLVKMHASGICYTDVHETLGHIPGQFPRILGHEPVGEIITVAPDVTTRKVGDRVGTAWIQSTCGRCEWCQRGRRMFCPYLKGTGIDVQGGHAEYMLMNADATYLIPGKVSYEQAAPIFCAGYTVYSGLRWADPKPHERVAVLGIGGLGHLAVQFAKAAGFETIAISHSPDKDKMIRELGADEIVRDGKSLAAMGGADIILSTSNSTKSMVDSIQGLRPDGRLVIMGADADPLSISIMDLLMRRIRIIGSQQNGPEYLYEALDFVAEGKVKTIVETYPLAEAPKAYQRVVEGKARFRAVLTM